MLESWLELRTPDGDLLPGYGWVFGVGDGTSNVGLGILNTTKAWQDTNYKDLLARWTASMPAEWQFDEEHATGPVRGGALPMGFNRQPHYTRRAAAGRRRRAARSTRSTARASPTPWSPAGWPPRSPRRRWPGPRGRGASGRCRPTRRR